MSDLRQAAQEALDAWDNPTGMKRLCVAMDALRKALEQQAEPVTCGYDETTGNCTRELCCRSIQPEQQAEPMAWIERDMQCDDFDPDSVTCEKQTIAADGWEWIPLYTTPPQRQWVGLTDEDVNRESAPIAQQMKLAFHAGMYVAQKILTEKNGG